MSLKGRNEDEESPGPKAWGRYRWPSLLVIALAIFGSLGVHLPIYGLLGWLAEDSVESAPASPDEQAFAELTEFEVIQETPPLQEDRELEPELEPEPEVAERPPQPAPEPVARRTVERVRPQARAVEEEQPEEQAPTERVPVPEVENRQSITQQSDDPTAEAPDDARFLAEENRRVEEETVARTRSMVQDDEAPQPASSEQEEDEQVGDAEDEVVAELEESPGDPDRVPLEEPAPSAAAVQPTGGSPEPSPATPRQAEEASRPAEEPQVAHDGFGTIRLERGPSARVESRLSQARPGDPRPWSELEGLVGQEELVREREAYAARQRSRSNGGRRDRVWRQFRAAVENFTPAVRPGNQTALNAAASPFAAFLAAVHRRIHRQFAHRFLTGLPTWSTSPFADRSLRTQLEIVFNRDGSIHRIGVVRSSGFEPFDFGAFNAVMRAQPYPPAPDPILSGDSRAYVHWGFYRNERQCGTFNARPYILPNPGGAPTRRPGPMDDRDQDVSSDDDDPAAPPQAESPPTVAGGVSAGPTSAG